MAVPVDDGKAFRLNKKGEARTDASLRQAKSRSSRQIVNAIVNAGVNDNDASAALKSALANPKVQHIAQSVILSEDTVSVASTFLQQQQRMIARASITGSYGKRRIVCFLAFLHFRYFVTRDQYHRPIELRSTNVLHHGEKTSYMARTRTVLDCDSSKRVVQGKIYS
jgi:hypothetical protein